VFAEQCEALVDVETLETTSMACIAIHIGQRDRLRSNAVSCDEHYSMSEGYDTSYKSITLRYRIALLLVCPTALRPTGY
jgi:hypothetical protein